MDSEEQQIMGEIVERINEIGKLSLKLEKMKDDDSKAIKTGRKIKDMLGQLMIVDFPWMLTSVTAKDAQKNQAYAERNKLVLALTKFLPAWLGKHDADDEKWDSEWMNIVYLTTPSGEQISWHIHDSEFDDFQHLPRAGDEYDGHDFAEKYERLARIEDQKKGGDTNEAT